MNNNLDENNNILIEEAIKYGSINNILKKCDLHNIYKTLLRIELSDKTMIAYKFLCSIDSKQLVNNNNNSENNFSENNHFYNITKYDEYKLIYKIICSDHNTITDNIKINTICDIVYIEDYDEQLKLIDIIIASDAYIIQKLLPSNKNLYKYYIKYDKINQLQLFNYIDYEKILLEKCIYLKNQANNYWNCVRDSYKNLIIKIFSQKAIIKLSNKKIRLYCYLFPKIFPPDIKNNLIYYKLQCFPNNQLAYLLGFPIHIYIPCQEDINLTLDLLKKQGLKKYLSLVQIRNKKYINKNKLQLDKKFNKSNRKDQLFYKICDYNLSELIFYFDKKHMYVFTRNEFDYILKNKKNIYTGEEVSELLIHKINERKRLLFNLGLPCYTLKYLIDNLDNIDQLDKLEEKEIKIDNPLQQDFIDLFDQLGIDYNLTDLEEY